MMAEEDVGRVILTDNAIPVGIFTERHVLSEQWSSPEDEQR